ncbi:FAD:protein FMN transferase [Arsukibacterium sp. UBA3155]|uniref:FAD:protein FMN transferase n=1 Tax=Arsukibacterium sp. UBA3155 TaxID=1946058 RepID=UPI0025BF3CF8|nr:FAD:protein FMN transferase [Arsukibacterium sp. UBA3155]|tara:strand:+ start:118718 stop:119752 length:1035 start_codon:yes stop_codon:yes gene_type:complete
MMQRVSPFSFIWLLAISLWLAGCSPQTTLPQEQVLQGNTMGTTYSVKFFSNTPVAQHALQQQIEQELELINDLMSTYRPASELMRFNQQQTTEPFMLSEQTAKVIAEAIRIGEQTNGVLDITVGPLVEKWGFGANGRINERPAPQALDAIQDFVGLDKISLSEQELIKTDGRVALDLSTIAKGYGVDRLAEILESSGVTDYLVDIGGEMRVSGSKPDRAWLVAIEKPVTGQRAMQRILAPGNMAVATSGDYRNYFEQDGVRYSHLIDPRTAEPIAHRTVSSTVIHPSSMTADGYATALHIMNAEEALQFANQHQLAALLIVKTDDGFTELVSEAFKPYLVDEER